MSKSNPRVGLFVTCIVDIMRPNIGFAAIKLLQTCGCSVEVPAAQTCCGQPAYNSGDSQTTKVIAKQVINAFEEFDYVVVPSGSCAAMIKIHFPELFENDQAWQAKASALAGKTFELISFIADVQKIDISALGISEPVRTKKITYHDSCSGYRELNIYAQPRRLLEAAGLQVCEMDKSTECCGFGGTFCVKYADISNAMVSDKSEDINKTGADLVTGSDYSCLMNIAGKLNRNQSTVKAYHVAEILANMTDMER